MQTSPQTFHTLQEITCNAGVHWLIFALHDQCLCWTLSKFLDEKFSFIVFCLIGCCVGTGAVHVGFQATCSELDIDLFLSMHPRVFVCADDCPGGSSVWAHAARALWRSGGESGNTPVHKWSAEFKSHPSWDRHAFRPGTAAALFSLLGTMERRV